MHLLVQDTDTPSWRGVATRRKSGIRDARPRHARV